MELIVGITFGVVIGQFVLIGRVLRRIDKLESRIRTLGFENKELAGRLDDIQAPRLREWKPPETA